ncbi:hypothetical protein ABW20_dc0110601 [Dactylellina cionopaga]|nr:hypothetical protein ABW20_dc0110601 [Dactylellina cionopaga]
MQLFRRRSKKGATSREAPKSPTVLPLHQFDLDTQHRRLDFPHDEPLKQLEEFDRFYSSELSSGSELVGKNKLKAATAADREGSVSPAPLLSPTDNHHIATPQTLPGTGSLLSKKREQTYQSEIGSLFPQSPIEGLRLQDSKGSSTQLKSNSKAEPLFNASLSWLSAHQEELTSDRHINSWDNVTEFLNCAYSVYQAGKSGWDTNSPADHFASALDQCANSNFRDGLIQRLLSSSQKDNVAAEMDASGPVESSGTLLPALPNPPPPTIVSQLDSTDLSMDPQDTLSLFQKDIFLDWHSKFAFSNPIKLATKDIIPTIQLPALVGKPDDISTAGISQERQSIGKDEGSNQEPVATETPTAMETPHPETYQPHPGLIELGRSLYTPQPAPLFSDSPLNMPRRAEMKPPPIVRQSTPLSPADMQLFDQEEEGYSIYGSSGLQGAILSGEVDPHVLMDQAQFEEENGIELLAPMVRTAVLEGKYDIVVQLVQRNMECIDVALKAAEENGKFALVKYLGMWKEHYRKFGNPLSGGLRGYGGGGPGGPGGPGPSNLNVPRIPAQPRKKFSDYSDKRGRLTPGNEFKPVSGVQPDDGDDLAVHPDDSEEVWKLRAIYLLILMIVLSETASTEGHWSVEGWDSMSTASSSRQSSQTPVDANEYTGGSHASTSSARLGVPSGAGRHPGSDKPKKKKRDDDSDESEDNHRRPRNRRSSNLKSLGKRYACPFAKAQPDNHVTCWTINRQNLAGVKEHLKRFHFGGVLPSDIRAARSWNEVFDVIAPDWGNKPRPSPYVDMLDIFQRSVRPPPPSSTAGSSILSPTDGLMSPQLQWPNQQPQFDATSSTMINTVNQAASFNNFGSLPADMLHPSMYNLGVGGGFPYQNSQQQFPIPNQARTPGSASTMGFENINYPMLPQNPGVSSPIDVAATEGSFNMPPSLANNIPFDSFVSQLAAPHFIGLSTQDLNRQFAESGNFLLQEFGIDPRQPAGNLFTSIMDSMEPAAPVPGLAPVFESSPEPDSAVSNETVREPFFPQQQQQQQQQQHLQTTHATSPPSIISSSNISGSGPSIYPPSSTSLGIHNMMAAAPPHMYHTLGATSIATPLSVSHASSPPSHIASKDRQYQLLISRNPFITGSTEIPGRKTFSFDKKEDFMQNFDNYMRYEFHDPVFDWEHWELMNAVTNMRLNSPEAVYQDADFTFLAHAKNRAGLYLVPKAF